MSETTNVATRNPDRRLLKLDRAIPTLRCTQEGEANRLHERLLFYHIFRAASYLWSAVTCPAFPDSSERHRGCEGNHSPPSSPGNNVTTRKTKESSVTTIVVTHAATLYSGPFA